MTDPDVEAPLDRTTNAAKWLENSILNVDKRICGVKVISLRYTRSCYTKKVHDLRTERNALPSSSKKARNILRHKITAELELSQFISTR